MRKALFLAFIVQIAATTAAAAAGPYGNIHVGNWQGGAFTDDNGAFSHCAATATYGNGNILVVGQNAANSWLLSFANSSFHLTKGKTSPIDVTFDGQSQARLFATANSDIMLTAVLPPNVARAFQKANLMVAVSGSVALNFNLTSTGPLLGAIANCVSTMKAGGINSAGEFAAPKAAAAKADASNAPNNPKSGKTGTQTGTGFVISASGHIVTNHHVINGCIGDIKGNLTGEAPTTLRVVNSDRANDLALLQGPAASFKSFARIRDRAMHSGDSIVAIGFPYRGLLSSDFTVTTGIVSSLSGLFNDTRFLQISAAVQPGNSGGPLFDTSGDIVGVVSAKIDTLRVAERTGTIPENINFAIKTGAIRDFLDNSVVAYETSAPGSELKTPDIAGNARAYTLLISCRASEQTETAKR
jgi:S1-C subfamily serine protease